MAAPAAAQPPPLLVKINEAEVNTTMPLPRAIQLVMAIVWSDSEPCKTTTAPMKTIANDRLLLWVKLVFLSPMCIVDAAGITTYAALCDNAGAVRELISFQAVIGVLLCVYWAALLAAGGHLGLFAPRTPVAAWEAFDKGIGEGFGLIVAFTSLGFMLLVLFKQAWPLLFAWACLLGLLIASVVAFWLCLRRTYGDGERRGNRSCTWGEAVVDGLACLYCRLLYEYAVRFHAVQDLDAGMQQLDADVAVPLLV